MEALMPDEEETPRPFWLSSWPFLEPPPLPPVVDDEPA